MATLVKDEPIVLFSINITPRLFKFLAHLPVDHLADPVVSSLIFLLC